MAPKVSRGVASELSRRKPKQRKVGRAFCGEGMT